MKEFKNFLQNQPANSFLNNYIQIIDFKKEDKRILEDKLETLLKKEPDYEFSEEDFLSIFRVYHPLNYEKNNIHRNFTGKLENELSNYRIN